jgi:hypothetical protein
MSFTVTEGWVIAEREDLTPGREILVVAEGHEPQHGIVIDFTPSGKTVIVKSGYAVRCVDPKNVMVYETVTASLIKEIQDMSFGDAINPPNPSDPDMQRINMYRSRIARDQAELSRLVLRYTKKQQAEQQKRQIQQRQNQQRQNQQRQQRPGTYTPAQMRAMQQQSAANAKAAQQAQQGQGYPTLRQTTK